MSRLGVVALTATLCGVVWGLGFLADLGGGYLSAGIVGTLVLFVGATDE